MINTREFNTQPNPSSYTIPKFTVSPGLGLRKTEDVQEINFVKGNIDGEEFIQTGIITENLLSMLIHHLNTINVEDLRNRHTSIAITKLEEALFWIEERKRDRASRGVAGTFKP